MAGSWLEWFESYRRDWTQLDQMGQFIIMRESAGPLAPLYIFHSQLHTLQEMVRHIGTKGSESPFRRIHPIHALQARKKGGGLR